MASVNRTSGSSYTSSLYNSSHIISGLASGMDTEGMIESLVQSYQTKIQNLSNKSTKLGWKQDAYRSIINKMTAFSSKYTSYTSNTNLMSSAFFSNAIKVAPQGENAKKVTASGRTDSDVRLNSVSQLATAARYVTGSTLAGKGMDFSISAAEGLDLNGKVELGTLQGSLSFAYGGNTVSISFDEATDIIQPKEGQSRAEALAEMITDKLGDQQITLNNGDTVSAADRIKVEVDKNTGAIAFSDKSTAGNNVYISGASDSIKSTLGLGEMKEPDKEKLNSFRVTYDTSLTKRVNTAEYLSGKSLNISLDGAGKSIQLPEIVEKSTGRYVIKDSENGERALTSENYLDVLNASLKKAFGSKVTAENLDTTGKTLQLKFNAPSNSNMIINSSAGEKLGIGQVATNYLNTSKTLGDLMEGRKWSTETDENGEEKDVAEDLIINGVKIGSYTKDAKLSDIMNDINANKEAGVKVAYSRTTREFVFTTKETGSQTEIKMGGLAEEMFGRDKDFALDKKEGIKSVLGMSAADKLSGPDGKRFAMEFQNGAKVDFTFKGEGGSLNDLLGRVNEQLTGGMKADFDEDGSLYISDGKNRFYASGYGEGENNIAKDLADAIGKRSGVSYTAGQDAMFSVTVNGTTMDMTRTTNNVDLDGMTVTFKDTFEDDGNPVTFERSTDSDRIVDTIKSMIDDYNEMMSEIRTQYATLPAQSSSGAFKTYEPLTDEERSTMSESAIKNYEEKAKQGLLFGDRNLSNLYERMRDVFSASGADGAMLSKIGISVGYDTSSGATTLTLNESKLRDALDEDPDAVADLFTKSRANGAGTDGLMQGMKTQLDRYAGLTGASKGILVQQAGTPLNSLSLLNNDWQKQMDTLSNEIEKWQDKLESQVDRYTSMFSKLEQLINQMNSQSSTLAGMMGG